MKRPDSERVVITGLGLTSPIGKDVASVTEALRTKRSGVRAVPAWKEIPGLTSWVAGSCDDDFHDLIPRKFRRSMGRVAQLATFATGQALRGAGLEDEYVRSGRVGIAVGSTTGSPSATIEYYANILGPGIRANKATAFLQVMSHTCAANVALAFGITGRVWSPSSACTSGAQAVGLGYETVRAGIQEIMICGGAEEVHFTTAGTFDLVGGASSRYNHEPTRTPRPFDRNRDGLVVGEGAGMLVLETLAHARARGAEIHGEILGFSTTCDGTHITQPTAAGMAGCMRLALESAGLTPESVDYVNAHATGTELGDATEAQASFSVFGDKVPLSSTKGYMGHTMAACGAIETILVLAMMREGFVAPTLNLEEVDPACRGPWHLMDVLRRDIRVAMNNNFAFGGINTSLVLAPSP